MKPKILVVDDDRYTRKLFEGLLRGGPYHAEYAENAAAARRIARDGDFNLILMDQRLPDGNGLDLLAELRVDRPRQVAILMTGYADVHDAVRAVREGLFDYLTKPFENLEELEAMIAKALELDRAYREIDRLRATLSDDDAARAFIGIAPQTERLLEQVKQVAPLDVTVLLEGESGTGKDLVAKIVHAASPRAGAPFLELNCGALPESLLESTLFGYDRGSFTGAAKTTPGYFERADGGTLFLDEIADMSPKLQSSLLRVLQSQSFARLGSATTRSSDFRLVCATNRHLAEEVREGRFRDDLYYRINVVALRLPSLRERREDIVLLAVHFLEYFSDKFDKRVGPLTPEAIKILERSPWPGNVRQVQHSMERVVALHPGGPVSALDLSRIARLADGTDSRDSTDSADGVLPSYREERERFEREYLQRLLKAAKGNVSEAARISGIARQNLYVRMNRLGIVYKA